MMNTYLHERYQASLDVSPINSPQHNRSSSMDRELPPLPPLPPSPVSMDESSAAMPITKHPSVPVWPDEPQRLQRGGWLSVLSCAGDIVVILTSMIFLIFASFVLSYDGKPVEDVRNIYLLRDAARYGPTVFPILFAAIVGQAMHAIAHWRLENGERMKVLDQFLGSTGLFSTVITQLKFRNIGLVGAGLICLWMLSPLGGQASLRVLDFGQVRAYRERSFYYLNRSSTFQPVQQTLAGWDGTESAYIANTLFAAALSSTKDIQQSGMDSWGNLKIPMIERLPSIQDSNGWRTIDHTKNVTYSSLIGVPVSPLTPGFNTTFNLDYAYWDLDCEKMRRPNSSRGDPFRLPGENGSQPLDSNPGWVVGTSKTWGISTLDFQKNNTNVTNRIVYYKGFDDDSGRSSNATMAQCTISTSYVEVMATCNAKNCSVTRIRPSQLQHAPSEFALGIDPITQYFFSLFHSAVDIGTFQLPTIIQRFFRHPYAPFQTTNEDLALYALPKIDFETSFAQLLNTFWQASIGVGKITTGVEAENDINPDSLNGTRLSVVHYVKTNATEYKYVPIVKCQRAWLAVLYIATSAMFLSGVFGLVLEFTRKAPDFALNISSLTRDNPYIHLPPGGSTLDSIDRSRLLQNVRIRLGDVKPDDPVGYIAIASCDEKGRVHKLRGLERKRTFQ